MKRQVTTMGLFLSCGLLAQGGNLRHLSSPPGRAKSFYFVQNRGQWHPDVWAHSHLPGGEVWITRWGLLLDWYQIASGSDATRSLVLEGPYHTSQEYRVGHRVRLSFIGANTTPHVEYREKVSYYHNYFIGNNPSRWVSYVPLYR
ncbi:MAG: hypothetical protein N2170_01800, partial [Bacteroidia bacterium]|nr:hypothetical protein [Bacteroidia bacterium]